MHRENGWQKALLIGDTNDQQRPLSHIAEVDIINYKILITKITIESFIEHSNDRLVTYN
jgi:hypothetical protein